MQSSQRCLTDLVPTLDAGDLSSFGFDQNVTTFEFFDAVSTSMEVLLFQPKVYTSEREGPFMALWPNG